jgi:hypothetical protein
VAVEAQKPIGGTDDRNVSFNRERPERLIHSNRRR